MGTQFWCPIDSSYRHYQSYTSSRYYPDYTVDLFLFLSASEGLPEEYSVKMDVRVTSTGLAIGPCTGPSCSGSGEIVGRFAEITRTRTEVVSFPFEAVTYEEYVTRAQAAGAPVRANSSASYGHVQVDLGAAGGSSTVTNMMSRYACGIAGDCGMRSGCSGTHTPVNLYEAEKEVLSLTVLSTGTQISPLVGIENSPPPRVRWCYVVASAGRIRPALSFSFSRYELPRMLMVVAWWRTRSRIAAAMTRSPKTSAQLPKLWLLVRIIGPRS